MPSSRTHAALSVGVLMLGSTLLYVYGFSAERAQTSGDAAERARDAIARNAEVHWAMSADASGTQVAYSYEYGAQGLFVATLDGSAAIERLDLDVAQPCRPTLSPDGARVAFVSCEWTERLRALYWHDRTTGATEVLSAGTGRRDWMPTWSPDSRVLAYPTSVVLEDGDEQFQLRLRDVTTGDEHIVARLDYKINSPSWSPDGERIAFLAGPQVQLFDRASGEVRVLLDPGTEEPAPGWWFSDAPAWSPSGDRLAYAFTDGDCHRVHVIDVASGSLTPLSPTECSMRPVWHPSGDELAYLRLGAGARTLWTTSGGDDGPRPLGFDSGVTYQFSFAADGRLVALASPPGHPRALWWIDASGRDRTPQRVPGTSRFDLGPEWSSLPEQATVASSDGLAIPLQVFPRTCGPASRPGPALLLVHYPGGDIAPRWYQEIQYAAAAGLTVVAVNYRGSTGNGRAFRQLDGDRRGQSEDIRAALSYTRSRADVDADHVYVLSVSAAADITLTALRSELTKARGIVDWVGPPGPWNDDLVDLPWPPMLWISAQEDLSTPRRTAVAQRLSERGRSIRHVVVPGNHGLLLVEGRARALAALAAFVAESSESICATDR